uniref:Uncharacterized protein n=1 Tax=Arundo donax TaxID=35708 RepID=A0A0A9TC07_ARUDO
MRTPTRNRTRIPNQTPNRSIL